MMPTTKMRMQLPTKLRSLSSSGLRKGRSAMLVLGRAEPVVLLAAVEHDLQRADAEAEQGEAEEIETVAVLAPRLAHEGQDPDESEDADRQVDVEDPAPIVVEGEPAAERRPEDRPDQLLGIDVEQHRLRQRHQRRAEHALQQPERHHLRQAAGVAA
jgi:hypothetical protein